jgi:ADP-ribose pyrophosphatase
MDKDKIWKIEKKKSVLKAKIFEIINLKCYLPSKDLKKDNFYVINLHDWVNVFSITEDKKVILVKQHRLGRNTVTLEVPAGAVEFGEDPMETAKRELEEETGYTADEMVFLKKISVNPAIQNNTCYFFLAKNCRKNKETHFDLAEELEVELMDIKKLIEIAEKSSSYEKINKDTSLKNDNGNFSDTSNIIDNSLSFLSIILSKEYLEKSGTFF